MIREDVEFNEYEVLAEVPVCGDFKHNDFHLMIWEFCSKKPGERRKLCLQLKEAKNIDTEKALKSFKSAKKGGRYIHLGRSQEIIVLASLFLQRRLSLPTLVRKGDKPLIINFEKYDPCFKLREKEANLGSLNKLFNLWDKADEDFKHIFLKAARLYYFACNLMDQDLGASYLMFTSAIETVASEHKLKTQPTLREVNSMLDKKITDLVKNKEKANELRNTALDTEGLISRKFVEYAASNITDKFWENVTGPENSRVKKREIKKILKNIYNQRSRTLHTGEPFPIYIYTPEDRGDISSAPVTAIEGKKWNKKEYIPYIHFMERLTNHILHTALSKHAGK